MKTLNVFTGNTRFSPFFCSLDGISCVPSHKIQVQCGHGFSSL